MTGKGSPTVPKDFFETEKALPVVRKGPVLAGKGLAVIRKGCARTAEGIQAVREAIGRPADTCGICLSVTLLTQKHPRPPAQPSGISRVCKKMARLDASAYPAV